MERNNFREYLLGLLKDYTESEDAAHEVLVDLVKRKDSGEWYKEAVINRYRALSELVVVYKVYNGVFDDKNYRKEQIKFTKILNNVETELRSI